MDRYAVSLNAPSLVISNRTPAEIFELSVSELLEPLPITMKPHTFPQLKSLAKISLLNHINDLIPFVEIDIYNKINYTCDYLINTTDSHELKYLENPLDSWYQESNLQDEDKYYSRLFKNHSRVSLPFDGLFRLAGNVNNGSFQVPALCNKFSFYVYENLTSLIWYSLQNPKRITKNKYLLYALKKVEAYDFSTSDFYLFECLTNIHSVLVISNILYRALSYENLENILDENKTKKEQHYATLIDKLISVVALSPLIYSKSFVLNELFLKAEEIFDINTEFELFMLFVTIQFELFDKLCKEAMPLQEISKKRFFKLYDSVTKECSQCDKPVLCHCVQEKNKKTFENAYTEASLFLNSSSLIKKREWEGVFQKINRTTVAPAFANVYVQKKFEVVLSGNPISKDSPNEFLEIIPQNENGNIFFVKETSSNTDFSYSINNETIND